MLATMICGARSGSRSRQSTSRRRPIVSTDGLNRSNGNVSHAGNTAMSSGISTNWPRSSASWPAIVLVGVATSNGRWFDSLARAAMATGRAISLIASRAPRVAEGAREPRLIAQQRGEISQSHGASRVPARAVSF